ncbi:MAG: hypothetical protein JWQ23_1879 [Herminiimonas sp.]|nr:hypothetical protein [Herminiimonas sp.]
MEFVILEIILWAGLIFFFWTLRDGLSRVENELEESARLRSQQFAMTGTSACYAHPDRLIDLIGTYKDAPIYRLAIIQGKNYQFDYVLPGEKPVVLKDGQRCLAPGLVYAECRDGIG